MVLTQRAIHRDRILAVLLSEPSGQLNRNEVLKRMGQRFPWTDEDQQPRDTRPWESKWANRASFERAALVREGLIANDEYGVWRLTTKGRSLARQLQTEEHVSNELIQREQQWKSLHAAGGPIDVPQSLLMALGFHHGKRDFYVPPETRSPLFPDGLMLSIQLQMGMDSTVGAPVTGTCQSYPATEHRDLDLSDLAATKAADKFGLPIFVISPGSRHAIFTVSRGHIEQCDDSIDSMLITFTEQPGRKIWTPEADHSSFSLVAEGGKYTHTSRQIRPNQSRFRFLVLQRYGAACAVCGQNIPELIQAAHLRPKAREGSDDPRNALPLCANHHIAFDQGLWAIRPISNVLISRQSGPSLTALGIHFENLRHLRALPHDLAIADAWSEWKKLKE